MGLSTLCDAPLPRRQMPRNARHGASVGVIGACLQRRAALKFGVVPNLKPLVPRGTIAMAIAIAIATA